jgi:hemolysin activation/secretion protein
MSSADVGGNHFLAPQTARVIVRSACCLGLLLLVNTVAQAQQAPPRPTPVDPLQIEKRIDEVVTERENAKKQPPKVPQLARPRTDGTDTPLFRLVMVSIDGARALPAETFEPIYHPYLNRTVSQRDLETIASGISDAYRKAGYHLSRAIIPPQDVQSGELRIQVVEGSISDIRVTGVDADRFGVRTVLAPILRERPSRLSTVERALLLANDTPGVRVADTALEEISSATGEFRLIVKAETANIILGAGTDNAGTHAVGPYQAYGGVAFNSYLLPGDMVSLTGSTVPMRGGFDNMRYGRIGYDVPVADGVRLGASASQSKVNPTDATSLTDTSTITRSYELRGSIVPWATRESSLAFTAALGVIDSTETEVTGVDFNDHIRTVTFGVNGKFHDTLEGWNFLGAFWRQGLNAMGATPADDPLISRDGATPNFSVLGYSYTRLQKITDAWSIKASFAGQFASGPLMSSQQFFLGGAGFGPGYFSGDNGYAASAELRFDQNVTDKAVSDYIKAYQIYGFIDGGEAWNMHDVKQRLSSAGIGLRLQLPNDTLASVAFAVPVSYSSQTEEFRQYRVLFSISSALKICPERPQLKCY